LTYVGFCVRRAPESLISMIELQQSEQSNDAKCAIHGIKRGFRGTKTPLQINPHRNAFFY